MACASSSGAATCITLDMIRGSTLVRTTLHKQVQGTLVVSQVESRTRCMASATSRCSIYSVVLAVLARACTRISDYCRCNGCIDSSNFRPLRSFSKCAASGLCYVSSYSKVTSYSAFILWCVNTTVLNTIYL
jgi:hypothetical protein